MKKRSVHCGILVCTLSLSSTLQARSRNLDATPVDEDSPSGTTSHETTSADNRARTMFNPALRFGLMGAISVVGAELNGNWGSSMQLGLSYASGKLDLSSKAKDIDSTVDVPKLDVTGQLIDAYLRYFLTNSFFVRVGLGYRTITYDMKVVSKVLSSSYIEAKGKSQSLVLTPGIGNIWQLDFGMTIGAEWIGASAPLTKGYSSETKTSGTTSSSLQQVADDNEKLAKNLSQATFIHALMVHVGWAF